MAGAATCALTLLMAPGARAQTADTATLGQMKAELDALRAEEAQAKAAEQARAKRIDALAQQLARASGEPVVQTPAVIQTPPPVQTYPGQAPVQVAENPAQGQAGAAPSFPRSDGGRKFEIYGFAQADYVQDFKRVAANWEDTLRPSRIPTLGGAGSNGQAVLSVKQSRFGVQAQQPVGDHDLYVRFEFDLFGVGVDEGQTTFRLRHAYGSWGPLLAGQTNSVFMDGDIFPNTIDYWGPSGMVFLRNPQVRYTYKTGPHEFAVAIEKPGNDIDAGQIREFDPALGAAIRNDEKIPDFTAHYRYNGDWGHVQLAGILRRVGYETLDTANYVPKGHQTGWGVNLTSNLKVFSKDVIHLGGVYGKGIASYMNDGGTDLGPAGQVVIQPDGSLAGLSAQVVPLYGLTAYYDHYWSDTLSSSIGWSQTKVDNLTFQSADAFNFGQYASVNLLWTPAKRIMMGAEFLWGKRKDNYGAEGDDTRLQLSFKYAFSSDDFR
jgi:hypothetical protein